MTLAENEVELNRKSNIRAKLWIMTLRAKRSELSLKRKCGIIRSKIFALSFRKSRLIINYPNHFPARQNL